MDGLYHTYRHFAKSEEGIFYDYHIAPRHFASHEPCSFVMMN